MRFRGTEEEGAQPCGCLVAKDEFPHTVKEHDEASCGGVGSMEPCGGCYDCVCAQIQHGERQHVRTLTAMQEAIDASRREWMQRINAMDVSGGLDEVDWPIEFDIETPSGVAQAMIFQPEDDPHWHTRNARMVVRVPMPLDRITVTITPGPPDIHDLQVQALRDAGVPEMAVEGLLDFASKQGEAMRAKRVEEKQRDLPD